MLVSEIIDSFSNFLKGKGIKDSSIAVHLSPIRQLLEFHAEKLGKKNLNISDIASLLDDIDTPEYQSFSVKLKTKYRSYKKTLELFRDFIDFMVKIGVHEYEEDYSYTIITTFGDYYVSGYKISGNFVVIERENEVLMINLRYVYAIKEKKGGI